VTSAQCDASISKPVLLFFSHMRCSDNNCKYADEVKDLLVEVMEILARASALTWRCMGDQSFKLDYAFTSGITTTSSTTVWSSNEESA
jgi:hypothetical protein